MIHEFDRPPTRLVMRAHDDARLPARPLVAQDIQSLGAISGEQLSRDFPCVTLRPVFSERQLGSLSRIMQRLPANTRYRPVDFSRFFFIEGVPSCSCSGAIALLRSCDGVTTICRDRSGPDPGRIVRTDPGLPRQGYLRPAPEGVDALYAWQRSGCGEGQRFVDLERGWTLDHQDLHAHDIQLLHGDVVDEARAHGTSVLGVVCGVNNELGSVGIAPHVSEVAVVAYDEPAAPRSAALVAAIEHLGHGDVLLIEAQVLLEGQLLGPIEAYPVEYHLIELATALGITVVEAGGNGTLVDGQDGHAPGLDMDRYRDADGATPFRRDTRDSGAILVSAARKGAGHARLPFAPYGERIDGYAWGEGVLAPSSDAAGGHQGVYPRLQRHLERGGDRGRRGAGGAERRRGAAGPPPRRRADARAAVAARHALRLGRAYWPDARSAPHPRSRPERAARRPEEPRLAGGPARQRRSHLTLGPACATSHRDGGSPRA